MASLPSARGRAERDEKEIEGLGELFKQQTQPKGGIGNGIVQR